MTAFRLLSLAEQRGLLDPKTVLDMREQLASVQRTVSAKEMAASLVKRGRLTEFQASSLLTGLSEIERAAAEGVDLLADTDEVSSLELLDEDSDTELPTLEAVPIAAATPESLEAFDSGSTEVGLGDAAVDLSADEPDGSMVGGRSINRPRGLKALFAKREGWQSQQRGPNFLLWGTGALILLSLLSAFLYFYLARETGDEFFEAAQQDYAAQAYDNSIKKYDTFIVKFPKHPKHSLAKVRRELAVMRRVTEANDWERAIEVFKSGSQKIVKEPAYDQAPPEFAGILPAIYQGFADRAVAAETVEDKEQQLANAAEVLQQIEQPTILPGSQRRSIELRLQDIQKQLATVDRFVTRERSRKQALVEIATAVDSNDTVKAYGIYKSLLEQYPGLRSNAELADRLKAVAAAEKNAVILSAGKRQATKQDHRLLVPNRVLLAKRRGTSKAAAGGQVFSIAHGAMYGLDAETGRVLWRRWLGYESQVAPLTVGGNASNDVVMLDEKRQELVRVVGKSGKLDWRLELGEPCLQPVIGQQLLLATRAGRLLSIDSLSGNVVRTARLPQQLSSPPLVEVSSGLIYQPGDHSSVYIFASDSLECLGVFATGHKSGTVSIAPIKLGDHLLVAEESGPNATLLQPLTLDGRGLGVNGGAPANVLRLEGHVANSKRLSEKAVLVTTDLGAAYVIASNAGDSEQPLRIVAKTPAADENAMAHFGVVLGDQVFVAGRGLERFEFQSANGKLVSRWTLAEASFHVAAPERRGRVVFVQYKRPASQAVRVAAMEWADPRDDDPQTKWTVDLGAAPAGPAFFDASRRSVVVVSNDAAAWEIGATAMKANAADKAVADLPSRTLYGIGQPLPDKSILYAARDGRKSYLIYNSRSRGSKLKQLEVQLAEDRLSCPLVVVGDNLVACTQSGLLFLVDPATGKKSSEPYQPKLEVGSSVEWVQPTMSSNGDIVAATKSGEVRLLATESGRLVSKLSRSLNAKLQSRLAALSDKLFVLGESGLQSSMICLQSGDLANVATLRLSGKYVAGPFVVGNNIVCATDDQMWHAFDAAGELIWSQELPSGPLAGSPVVDGDSWICASVNGQLWRVAPASGESVRWRADSEAMQFDVGEPLGAAPFKMSSRLLLLGRDSTLFVVSLK